MFMIVCYQVKRKLRSPCVSRSWVDKMTCSNLLQKSQPLKLARIDDGHGHRRDVDVPMDAENIFVTVLMQRISLSKFGFDKTCKISI